MRGEVYWANRRAHLHEDVALLSDLCRISRPGRRFFNKLLAEIPLSLVKGNALSLGVVKLSLGRLSRDYLTEIANLLLLPLALHNDPRMVSRISALLASRAAISPRISLWLRCLTSPLTLGFLTERSNVS